MKDNTNYSLLEKNFKANGGYITREDVDNAYISSWFLSDFGDILPPQSWIGDDNMLFFDYSWKNIISS